MTVKCLTEAQKDVIVELYRKHGSIPDLVVAFRRSDTTIYRVLTERHAQPVRKRKTVAKTVSTITPKQPVQLPLFTQTPAYLTFKAQLPKLLPTIGKPYAPRSY